LSLRLSWNFMNKTIFLTALLVVFLSATLSAQFADKAEIQSVKSDYLGLKPASKPFSLIDLSRIKWSNSYSLSFFSGGGTSGSLGLLTSSIFYEISSSLSLNLKMGIAHDPGRLFDRNGNNNNAAFLPGFKLDYHPSSNFNISVGFETVPDLYYLYSPYRTMPWRYENQ
jgi:hypothetical protein